MPFEIHPWEVIANDHRDTILLGNGASISVSQSLSYTSLLQHAIEEKLLPPDAQRLFDFFNTHDFEMILRIVWQASNVNQSLKIEDKRTHAAYLGVRDCLIQSVQNIHPSYEDVSAHLPNIYRFLKNFNTVLSLNYDLILYWAVTYGLDIEDGHAFKDCFLGGGAFYEDWQRLRNPIGRKRTTTLVFYPHGSLMLCRNRIEEEFKIHNIGAGLLEAILERWQSEQAVPLFVSEGVSTQKITAIRNSFYLSTVYREVLPASKRTLVIYGWGFGEHDLHLLRRMSTSGIQSVAVSVFGEDQIYCNRAFQIIQEILGNQVRVLFFNSESLGCWRHALENP